MSLLFIYFTYSVRRGEVRGRMEIVYVYLPICLFIYLLLIYFYLSFPFPLLFLYLHTHTHTHCHLNSQCHCISFGFVTIQEQHNLMPALNNSSVTVCCQTLTGTGDNLRAGGLFWQRLGRAANEV